MPKASKNEHLLTPNNDIRRLIDQNFCSYFSNWWSIVSRVFSVASFILSLVGIFVTGDKDTDDGAKAASIISLVLSVVFSVAYIVHAVCMRNANNELRGDLFSLQKTENRKGTTGANKYTWKIELFLLFTGLPGGLIALGTLIALIAYENEEGNMSRVDLDILTVSAAFCNEFFTSLGEDFMGSANAKLQLVEEMKERDMLKLNDPERKNIEPVKEGAGNKVKSSADAPTLTVDGGKGEKTMIDIESKEHDGEASEKDHLKLFPLSILPPKKDDAALLTTDTKSSDGDMKKV